jgi:predicted RNA-binding protein with PIN domain
MIIIVDGYNVLKQGLHKAQTSALEKKQFIAQLNHYSTQKRHTLVVVFDGGPFWGTDTEKMGAITVVHSGSKESADDYIMRYLDVHKNKDLLLISTDRSIGQNAWNLGVESIDAIDFYQLLQEETHQESAKQTPPQKAIKLTKREYPELDALMRQASQHVTPKKELGDKLPHQRPKKTLPKKERRMLKKIKKL